jgi:hypothetical protein
MNHTNHLNWSRADLHLHTTHSDGMATVPELLAHVAHKTNLKVIAITDHDTIVGAKLAARLAARFGLEVIVGEEVSTADGHLLALFIDKHLPKGRPVSETLTAIHAQGGLAIVPHPFDASVQSLGCGPARKHFFDLPFDGIEGFNGGVLWQERNCNRVARQAAAQFNLSVVGGSDAHSLHTVGKGFTWFNGRSANDLYRAIQAGAVQWAGRYWSLRDYAQICWQGARQHGTLDYVRWMLSMSGSGQQAEA